MTTVSTPHSANQSTSRCRSVVKVPKLRTGSGVRSAFTAAMCMVAPTSIAAAFEWTRADADARLGGRQKCQSEATRHLQESVGGTRLPRGKEHPDRVSRG